ncbi:hypothetical protein COM88_33610, partial [Bacillus cereus]
SSGGGSNFISFSSSLINTLLPCSKKANQYGIHIISIFTDESHLKTKSMGKLKFYLIAKEDKM